MRPVLLAGLFTATALAQTTLADGLIYQLPPDGSSVRYDLDGTFTTNKGEERTRKGSLTISTVGTATIDGTKCRWIEFKNVAPTNSGQERITIDKLLIPEEHLGRGKSAGAHLVKGWVKSGDSEPLEIKDFKSQPEFGILAVYLAGPPENSKELEMVEIDGKLGKLSCLGVTGDQEFPLDKWTLKTQFESRIHEKAPFGVVSGAWKVERRMNGKSLVLGTIKLKLAEISTTAISELPDRN